MSQRFHAVDTVFSKIWIQISKKLLLQPKNESMKKAIYLILLIWTVSVLIGCTNGGDTKAVTREGDSFYIRQAAMSIYAYQPIQALQILDSAVVVGNLSYWQADVLGHASTALR